MLSGCLQEGYPSVANITVVDGAGALVEGATVYLYCEPADCMVEDEKVTDAFGFCRFEFPEPVVLKAIVSKKIITTYIDTAGNAVASTTEITVEDWVIIPHHDEMSQEIVLK